jgi:F-type H+-transporting ATPase subunit delta
VPEPVVNLVCLLVRRGRIEELPEVAAEFRHMLNEQRGTVDAVARTARPLTEEETAMLQEKVAQMTGRSVHLDVELDESLIGGLTVRVGDTLYDASVRGRLERLRERLVAGVS